MPKGRPVTPLALTLDQEAQLRSVANATSLPSGLTLRARIVLDCAAGMSNKAVAEKFGVSPLTVGKWRKRFVEGGVEGLHDELRSGRPRTYGDERVAEVIKSALEETPKNATHWSVRSMARHSGLSKSTVQRWFEVFGVKPHLRETPDPFFVEKVIVGLYLNPPEHAVALCVDEKIQALDRARPTLPLGLGYVEGYTHDYIRHGATTLFAALDAATGQAIATCKQRHRHQGFLDFLRLVDRNVPEGLDIHMVADNYATHKQVRAWIAQRPRYHLHFTPTYASWLNQVERWFGLITETALRRGSHVGQLVNCIKQFTKDYNRNAAPFVWVATAESIKVKQLSMSISGTAH